MKVLKTKYDMFGWRLIVKRFKGSLGNKITHIYLRSKYGHHDLHKRFYLRLDEKSLKDLKKLLREIEKSK